MELRTLPNELLLLLIDNLMDSNVRHYHYNYPKKLATAGTHAAVINQGDPVLHMNHVVLQPYTCSIWKRALIKNLSTMLLITVMQIR